MTTLIFPLNNNKKYFRQNIFFLFWYSAWWHCIIKFQLSSIAICSVYKSGKIDISRKSNFLWHLWFINSVKLCLVTIYTKDSEICNHLCTLYIVDTICYDNINYFCCLTEKNYSILPLIVSKVHKMKYGQSYDIFRLL